jgi:hypothetical protein
MAESYSGGKGDIASPVGKRVVDSLTRKGGNSLPVRHNEHPLGTPSGSSIIKSPVTDSIVTRIKEAPVKG